MPINWNRRKYTKEEFIEAWEASDSIAECARKLNLTIFGSTYRTMATTAKELNLTKTHMTGQAWLKGKHHGWSPRRSNEIIFVAGKNENNNILKQRLLEMGWSWECHSCGLKEWLGEKIPIELEHVDGDSTNNVIENLKFLCPNCHALTPTWRGRNRKRV